MSARRTPGIAGADFADVYARLVARDFDIIEALGKHRVFTTAMLADLYFPSAWAARIRALTLTEMGVLARFRDQQRGAYRYTLGYWGAAILADRHGRAVPTRPAVAAQVRRVAVSAHRGHLEAVNGFFARLHAAARADGSLSVGAWLCEEEAAGLFLGKVRPDGAATLTWAEGAVLPVFFEYDTGTETLTYLVGKLDRYCAKVPLGGHRPVLFAITKPRREEHFHRLAGGHRYPFPVATAANTSEVFGPIWRLLGSIERIGLTDLAEKVRP